MHRDIIHLYFRYTGVNRTLPPKSMPLKSCVPDVRAREWKVSDALKSRFGYCSKLILELALSICDVRKTSRMRPFTNATTSLVGWTSLTPSGCASWRKRTLDWKDLQAKALDIVALKDLISKNFWGPQPTGKLCFTFSLRMATQSGGLAASDSV